MMIIKITRPYFPIVIALQLKYNLSFPEAVKRCREMIRDEVVRYEPVEK